MIVRCGTDDFVFPNKCVAGIHGLEDVRRVDLHGLACVGAKFVLYVLGNVRDVRSTEQKASIPSVEHDDATIFAQAANTCIRQQSECKGKQKQCRGRQSSWISKMAAVHGGYHRRLVADHFSTSDSRSEHG